MYKIALIGLGNIGKRHLESFTKTNLDYKIYCFDINNKNLKTASELWENKYIKNGSGKSSVVLITDLCYLPKILDAIIIATSSNVRLKIISNILNNHKIFAKHWILEKILAQSIFQLEKIKKLLVNRSVWVNTPRKMMPWYNEIYKFLPKGKKLNVLVEGFDWGLACNAIHFIDLFLWWNNDYLISANIKNLNPQWYNSKRNGYFEINGKISFKSSKGAILILNSSSKLEGLFIIIKNNNEQWTIDITNGEFFGPKNFIIKGRELFLSEMTNNIIEELLMSGKCRLTPLTESIEQHKILLSALIKHWNIVHKSNIRKISIT